MALPSNPTSTAGVTNRTVSVAGTSGYTGTVTYGQGVTQYLISDPATRYVDENSGAVGKSNLNYGSGRRNSGLGLPKISGLDKALGALGAGVAAYQSIVGAIDGAVAAGSALAAAGRQLKSSFSSLFAEKKSPADDPFTGKYARTSISNDDWRVKINTNWAVLNSPLLKPLADTDGMVFPYLPNINVTHRANYTAVDPIHNNFTIQNYKGSSVEDITITGEFSVDSQEQGEYWIAATTFLKTVTKMFYGQSVPQGNPPLVCRLSGYGQYVFDDIPVVVKNYQVEFKDGVQYKRISPPGDGVRTARGGVGTWVPVLSTITVVVAPIYSRQNLRRFNLQDYANGKSSGVL
jgi:hypothetical protein